MTKETNKNSLITAVLLTALIMGVIGFFGGMKYQESRRGNFRQFGNGQQGQGRQMLGSGAGSRGGFRPVTGEIIGQDATSITVKLPDGSSKIVILSEKTAINKADQATKEELKNGQTVAVFGTENTDGSVTAQNIQLNPMMREQQGSQSAQPSSAPTQ